MVVVNGQFKGCLEVSDHVLCSLPVLSSEGIDMLTESIDSKGDVGSCCEGDVAETPHGQVIWQLGVVVCLLQLW